MWQIWHTELPKEGARAEAEHRRRDPRFQHARSEEDEVEDAQP